MKGLLKNNFYATLSNAKVFAAIMLLLGLFVIGVGISLFMGAIFFPLFYVGGEERNEVFLVISLLCGIGFVMGLTTLINTLFPAPMTTMQIILGGVIIFACALLVFVISCPVTAYVYHKREY